MRWALAAAVLGHWAGVLPLSFIIVPVLILGVGLGIRNLVNVSREQPPKNSKMELAA